MVKGLKPVAIEMVQAGFGGIIEQRLHRHDELNLVGARLFVQVRFLPVQLLPALHDFVNTAAGLFCISKEGEHRLQILVAADTLAAVVVLSRSDEQDAGVREDYLIGILVDGHRRILQIVGMHAEVCKSLSDSDMSRCLVDTLVAS